MLTLAERLGELLAQRGDVPKLARGTGLKTTTIRGYLQGPAEPQLRDGAKIARALGVNLEWLATGDGPKWRYDPPASSPGVNRIDESILIEVVTIIDEALYDLPFTLGPVAMAKVIAAVYDETLKERAIPSSDKVKRYLHLVA